jgi:hypothetical protein
MARTIGELAFALCLVTAVTAAAQTREPSPNPRPVKVVADQRLLVATASGQGVLPLYLSRDWDRPLPDITRAVLVVHRRHLLAFRPGGGRGGWTVRPRRVADRAAIPRRC